MNKIDDKITILEQKSTPTKCNGQRGEASDNSHPNASTTSKNSDKNSLKRPPIATLTRKRGSMPTAGQPSSSSTPSLPKHPLLSNSLPSIPLTPPPPSPGNPLPPQSSNQHQNNKLNAQGDNVSDSDEDFIEVKSRKSRRPKRVTFTGTGAADDLIQSSEPVRKIHACFFKHCTTEDAVRQYLAKATNEACSDITVTKIKLRHQHYASFVISIPNSKAAGRCDK